MTLLGIRFPKQILVSQTAATEVPSVTMLTTAHLVGSPYQPAIINATIPVAPARYSEVRKVVFHVSARLNNVDAAMKLRMAAMSTQVASLVADALTLSPGSSNRVSAQFAVPGFNAGHLFAKVGDSSTTTLPKTTSQISGPTFTLTIEFDRFEAGSADFFNFWDSQTDADAYLFFRPVLERVDGANTDSEATFADMGITIIQAPSGVNKTCTLVPLTIGYRQDGSMGTAYTTGYRGQTFRYIAENWDAISSVHILTSVEQANGSDRDCFLGLHKVDTYEPYAPALLYEEEFDDNAASPAAGDQNIYRSADVKSLLVDGADHMLLMRRIGVAAISLPFGWLEIIQSGFSRTESLHDAGTQCRVDTTPSIYGSPATPPFDPTWYQSFPDEFILSRHLHLSFRHDSAVINTEIGMFFTANMEANVIGLGTTDPFIASVTPRLSATPSGTTGIKKRYDTTFSPDPINLAGMRKLVFGIVVGTGAGTDDSAGTARLVYALFVPARQFPEIGPVFDLGAFNPEGCAATSAGLGDPGVLVITNGSTIPKKFNPGAAGTDAEIEDVSLPLPYEGEVPVAVVDDTAASPEGGLNVGIYKYRYTFRNCCTGKESDPSLEDITVDTSGASPAAQVTLNFTGIRIPADPQICEICVYRTVVGGDYPIMAKVGCFDPDTTSVFVDTVADEALDFTNDGLSLLNGPMPCVPIVVDYRNRLFGMGDIPNLTPAGTVSATQGSDIITGSDDVEWDRCMEGKLIYLDGDCRGYEILRVLPPSAGLSPSVGRLKLVEPYEGGNTSGNGYHICGKPNRLYWSEPLEPEYWPAANHLDVEPGDGDRLMGAVSNFDSLVICKRRKTYVLRFTEEPGTEVVVPARISSDIGCIAPRSFAQVESGSVWLADRGLAIFDGRGVQHIEESMLMNDMFIDPDNPSYVRRDQNGRVIDAVGVFYPKRQQYLLLLPTIQTDRGCNMMLVWDTKLRNVTLLKFCQEFQSMTVAKDADGNERVYMGDTNGFVWIFDIGDTDGVGFPNATGTVRGEISSVGTNSLGADFLTDDSATFISGGVPGLAGLSGIEGLTGSLGGDLLGMAGACVYVRRKDAAIDDEWVARTVYAATDKTLFITPPWGSDKPDVANHDYDYMLGAIRLECIFKPQNYSTDDYQKRNWRQVLVHEVEDFSSKVRVELLPDFQSSDPEEGTVVDENGDTGKGRVFSMDYSRGRQVKPVGRDIHNFMAVRLSNFAPEEPIRIINHLLMLTPSQSR